MVFWQSIFHSKPAEVADLDELFAVGRIPYSPPDDGFPDVKFAAGKNV
jgi:hypothetical protein